MFSAQTVFFFFFLLMPILTGLLYTSKKEMRLIQRLQSFVRCLPQCFRTFVAFYRAFGCACDEVSSKAESPRARGGALYTGFSLVTTTSSRLHITYQTQAVTAGFYELSYTYSKQFGQLYIGIYLMYLRSGPLTDSAILDGSAIG